MEMRGEDNKALQAVAAVTRKRSSMTVMRAALVLLRGRSPQKPASDKKSGFWKTVLAAVSPLPPEDLPRRPPQAIEAPPTLEAFHDVTPPPLSSGLRRTTSGSSSAADPMSRYASAEDLKELDKSDDDNPPADSEDHAIDAAAEAFIARFYEQIRLQRLESMNKRFNESSLDGITG